MPVIQQKILSIKALHKLYIIITAVTYLNFQHQLSITFAQY